MTMWTKSIILVVYMVMVGVCLGADEGSNSTEYSMEDSKTYSEAEKDITDYINSFLRSLLPKIVSGSSGASVSPKCTAAMMKFFGNVRKLKGWTLKMLDSIGKPSSGILMGKSYSLGHYDQCLDLSVSTRGQETTDPSEEFFRGQYCKMKIRFPKSVAEMAMAYHDGQVNATSLGKLREFIEASNYVPRTTEIMSHYIGVCLPSLCTVDDVEQMVRAVSFPGSANVEECQVKTETKIDFTQTVVIGIFLTLMCMVCLGTMLDRIFHHGKQEKSSTMDDNRCLSIFVSFSACNNTRRLMSSIEEDEETPEKSIRGIFAASVAWIIFGHAFLMPSVDFYQQASSLENLRHYLTGKTFAFVVSYPLAVDTLFMYYGFLFTYRIWHSSSKNQKVNVNVLKLIFQRYIRLCFPVALSIGLVLIIPLAGSGPFWKSAVEDNVAKCKENGWAYIGMFGNLMNLDDQCLPHLWFVPCLLQISIVAAIMCWILSKNMKFGIFLLVCVSLACNLAVGVLTVSHKLPPAYLMYFGDEDHNLFWKVNYSLPLSHFGPFAVGMILGIIIARRIHCRLRPILALLGWTLSIAVICGLILTVYQHRREPMSTTWSAVYAANHRTLFAICAAWVLMACAFGKGGFVSAILSWRVLDPVFRLSYFAYLLHYVVILMEVGTARENFHYCFVHLILKALGYLSATYLLSYIVSLLLELPLRSLQDVFCKSRHREMKVNDMTSPKSIPLGRMDSRDPCRLWSMTGVKNGVENGDYVAA